MTSVGAADMMMVLMVMSVVLALLSLILVVDSACPIGYVHLG